MVSVIAPTDVENLPASQSLQVADPADGLNFPSAHWVQLPWILENPALHVQSVTAVLAKPEVEYAGHARHSV